MRLLDECLAADPGHPECAYWRGRDLLQRGGSYKPPPGASDIIGLEVAGVVVDLGAGVRDSDPCFPLFDAGYAGLMVDGDHCVAAVANLPDDFQEAFAVSWMLSRRRLIKNKQRVNQA